MYWQVYLHKTAVSAEKMLSNLMLRAKELTLSGTNLNCSSSLKFFLENQFTISELIENDIAYHHFIAIDDFDIWNAIKIWQDHSDKPLSWLSKGILNRNLFQVKLYDNKLPESILNEIKEKIKKEFNANVDYYFSTGILLNSAYISTDHNINVLTDNGDVKDIIECAELPNIASISKIVKKHYLCWPKTISLLNGIYLRANCSTSQWYH